MKQMLEIGKRVFLAGVSMLAGAGMVFGATALSLSFEPGFRLIDGSSLNTMVAAIAALQGGAPCTVAASSNAGTCNGKQGVYTTGSLSTAHGAAATAQVISNTSVAATSVVQCTVNGYSGVVGTNGIPVVICVPTAGTITATVANSADTNALSGTVGIGFTVFN